MNQANIIMIPKKKGATAVHDFRSISVINAMPKLLSKFLALRLSVKLGELVSLHQSTFIHGLHIAENFIVTRDILNHINTTKNPSIMVKLNFSKAFDSINWDYLEEVLLQRSFPTR